MEYREFFTGKILSKGKKKLSNIPGRKQVLQLRGVWCVPGTAAWLLYRGRVILGESRMRLAEGDSGGLDCCKGP